MSLPRLRLTLRRMKALVAVLAVLMAGSMLMFRRSVERHKIACEHQRKSEIANLAMFLLKTPRNGEPFPSDAELQEGDRWWSMCLYHDSLALKYRGFARYPWCRIPPDPAPLITPAPDWNSLTSRFDISLDWASPK